MSRVSAGFPDVVVSTHGGGVESVVGGDGVDSVIHGGSGVGGDGVRSGVGGDGVRSDVAGDGIRGDEIRSDGIRGDGIRSDGIRGDGVRSDGIRSVLGGDGVRSGVGGDGVGSGSGSGSGSNSFNDGLVGEIGVGGGGSCGGSGGGDGVRSGSDCDPGFNFNHTICAICQDIVRINQSALSLPCSHIFHYHCIDQWKTFDNHVCPQCRTSFRGKIPTDRPMMSLHDLPFFNQHLTNSVFSHGYSAFGDCSFSGLGLGISFEVSARFMELCGGHVRSSRSIVYCGPHQDNIRYDRAVVTVFREGTYIYRRIEEGQGIQCLHSLTAVKSSMYPVELHANFNISVRGTLITPFSNFHNPIVVSPVSVPFPPVQAILMSMRDVAATYRGGEGVARLSSISHPSARFKNYEVVVDLTGLLLHRRTEESREMFYFNNSAMPINIDSSGVVRIKVPETSRRHGSHELPGAVQGITRVTAADLLFSAVDGWIVQQMPPSRIL